VGDPDRLPPWVTGQQRPYPDAGLLLLPGNPTLVGSGFVGHAGQTADWVHAHAGAVAEQGSQAPAWTGPGAGVLVAGMDIGLLGPRWRGIESPARKYRNRCGSGRTRMDARAG